jgi:uncharacterized OsmC-like protein
MNMRAAMTEKTSKMTFTVTAQRIDEHHSLAVCDSATVTLDTSLSGQTIAFNPAELLLAALAACMIKGIERVTPILKFDLRGLTINLHGIRQDVPPRMESITYDIVVDTDESTHRLELLHHNVQKFGTVFNTLAAGTTITGQIRHATPVSE